MLEAIFKYRFDCSPHRWVVSAPDRIGTPICIPPLKRDELRSSTVLPYLEHYHYGTDEEQVYYTEHDINGELDISYFHND